jgi:DNA invertase Pin-like site-specific DNA recombinase
VRAALYARLSKEDGRATEDTGTERQLKLGRAFAEKQGWKVVEPYVLADDGVSGANFTDRGGLQRLLAGRRPAQAQALRRSDRAGLDRLGREMVAVQDILKQLTRARIELWTTTDGQCVRFGTLTEKLMVGVKGMANEQYRVDIKDKTTTALRATAAQAHATGPASFGYTRVPVGGPPAPKFSESGKKVRSKRQWDHVVYEINETEAAAIVFSASIDPGSSAASSPSSETLPV